MEKTMKKDSAQYAQNRRTFLKGVMAAGGVTALTAVSASHFTDSHTGAAHAQERSEIPPQGYRESEHVKAYYRALRD
jgi:hypothetical protein